MAKTTSSAIILGSNIANEKERTVHIGIQNSQTEFTLQLRLHSGPGIANQSWWDRAAAKQRCDTRRMTGVTTCTTHSPFIQSVRLSEWATAPQSAELSVSWSVVHPVRPPFTQRVQYSNPTKAQLAWSQYIIKSKWAGRLSTRKQPPISIAVNSNYHLMCVGLKNPNTWPHIRLAVTHRNNICTKIDQAKMRENPRQFRPVHRTVKTSFNNSLTICKRTMKSADTRR